ncbi:hypothetical protein [Plantactinospora veratri]
MSPLQLPNQEAIGFWAISVLIALARPSPELAAAHVAGLELGLT